MGLSYPVTHSDDFARIGSAHQSPRSRPEGLKRVRASTARNRSQLRVFLVFQRGSVPTQLPHVDGSPLRLEDPVVLVVSRTRSRSGADAPYRTQGRYS